MLKNREMNSSREHGSRYRTRQEAVSSDGRVYCFVEVPELRRLLSQLAGTELLGELVRSVGKSAGEAQLPPALL